MWSHALFRTEGLSSISSAFLLCSSKQDRSGRAGESKNACYRVGACVLNYIFFLPSPTPKTQDDSTRNSGVLLPKFPPPLLLYILFTLPVAWHDTHREDGKNACVHPLRPEGLYVGCCRKYNRGYTLEQHPFLKRIHGRQRNYMYTKRI